MTSTGKPHTGRLLMESKDRHLVVHKLRDPFSSLPLLLRKESGQRIAGGNSRVQKAAHARLVPGTYVGSG
jgi:hypothetical protein